MIRRPPRSTRTDTLLPYPTLFRSIRFGVDQELPRGHDAFTAFQAGQDLREAAAALPGLHRHRTELTALPHHDYPCFAAGADHRRSEEHTSELQSLMRISYAVFCLKKKKQHKIQKHDIPPHNK